MTNNKFWFHLPLPLAWLALTTGVILHGEVFAQNTSAPAAAKPGELEEIQVTGVRASLEKSLDMKKNAVVALDSINSLELGRFPDADVADSLSHLPGITITRTTGGDGQRVNVQGLGPQYNLVTLNNRILATDDDGRSLAFDVLPSEVIAGADVLKSAQASALEGSIGGTVNLRTASPFDNQGLHGGVHAEGDYNQMSHLHGSKFSAFFENTNESGTLGFLAAVVHSQNNLRTDALNNFNQATYGPQTYPFDGTGNATTLASTPCCISFGSIFDKKKRDAVSGSVEWRPSSDFKLVADGLFTRLNDPQNGYYQSYYFPAGTNGSPWQDPVIQNGVVTGVTSNFFQPEIVNSSLNRQVDTSQFGLPATWKPTDKLSFTGDAYRSKASRPEGGNDTYVTAGLVTSTATAPDTLILTDLPNSLPNVNVFVPPSQLGLTSCPQGTAATTTTAATAGQCSYTALMNSGFLNNNKYWSTHYDSLNGFSVEDRVSGLTLDGAYNADAGWLSKVLFGVGANRREKSRDDRGNDWTNGSGQYGSLYNTLGCNVQCSPYSFGSQGFNVISIVNSPNFMQGAGGTYPATVPQLDVSQLLAFLRSLDGKQNPFFCTQPAVGISNAAVDCAANTQFNFANTLPRVNPFDSYAVTEKTLSFYGELVFGGTDWSGNLGLRVVNTKTTASTGAAVPTALWTPTLQGTTRTYVVIYPTSLSTTRDTSYTLPLPSLNLNYWIVPDRVQLRLALAQTMSRPNLSALAPTSTNGAIGGNPTLNYTGTAGLKPVKSTQANIALEWYYQPHSAFTAAVFAKKLRDDIYSGVRPNVDLGTIIYNGGPPGTVPGAPFLWTITAPTNGARSDIYGIELSWQHIMENGFGVHVQYTKTQNKSYDQNGTYVGAINAVPPMTLSTGVLYEKGPVSLDLNWDYAASYQYACAVCTDVAGWPAIASPFNWVTASAHFKFTQEFEVYVEGKNLTNAIARGYLNGNPLLPWANGLAVGQSTSGVGAGYTAFGRFFTVGAAYKF